jgi:hypothetical protein
MQEDDCLTQEDDRLIGDALASREMPVPHRGRRPASSGTTLGFIGDDAASRGVTVASSGTTPPHAA